MLCLRQSIFLFVMFKKFFPRVTEFLNTYTVRCMLKVTMKSNKNVIIINEYLLTEVSIEIKKIINTK